MQSRYNELKSAERGALLSIVSYIVLAALKIFVGGHFFSAAVQADGWNNFTDVLSSIAVLIGLRLARRPADDNHPYGHWKVETIASLATSFVMLFIGGRILKDSFESFAQPTTQPPEWLVFWIGLCAGLLMLVVCAYNTRLAKQTQSMALSAAAKDTRNDALISFSTSLAVLGALWFQWYWLDGVMAAIVGIMIIKTAISIFTESAFSLSDGFDTALLARYHQTIANHPDVLGVTRLHARYYGAQIYVDVTILVEPTLTVRHSHAITEQIEQQLQHDFGVIYTDVHVEPAPET